MDDLNQQITPIFTHVPHATRQVFQFLSQQNWLKTQQWYLAGGTALTLQFDLRTSVDLDFFTPRKNIDTDLAFIVNALSPDWVTTNQAKDTLYGELSHTKISFIAYPYFVPQQRFLAYGTASILDARDIAVMKIIAISQRGKKRDFFDLYWYIHEKEPLIPLLQRIPVQYPQIQHNYHHILKSLTYFVEAENDPDPQIFFSATWEEVKKYFLSIIPHVADVVL